MTFSEFPLVDRPTAMSPGWPSAAIWRAKTTSKPTSFDRAVTTATSFVSAYAGHGRPRAGCRNIWASAWASLELPPLPNASSFPPAAKRARHRLRASGEAMLHLAAQPVAQRRDLPDLVFRRPDDFGPHRGVPAPSPP